MSDNEEYNCDVCNQSFTSMNSKDSHMSTQKHLTNTKFNQLTNTTNTISNKLDMIDLSKVLIQNKEILKKLNELKIFEEHKHKILQDFVSKALEKEDKSINNTCFIIAGIPIVMSIGIFLFKNLNI